MRDPGNPVDPLVWCNGAIVRAGGAVSALDRGFTLGDGAFETMRVTTNGCVMFWDQHRVRLVTGLSMLDIDPRTADAAPRAIAALAEATARAGPCVARLTITRGVGGRGLRADPGAPATMVVALSDAPPVIRPSIAQVPIRVIAWHDMAVATGRLRRFKHIAGYGLNALALRAALTAGADDAMLFNATGAVVGATTANMLAIRPDGAAITPGLDEGALPGVCRDVLLAAGGVTAGRISSRDLPGHVFMMTNIVYGPRKADLVGGGQPWASATGPQAATADLIVRTFDEIVGKAASVAMRAEPS